jgi:ADP-heptose:LPS heptosyltransferase
MHFKGAKELFNHFGVTPEIVIQYTTEEEKKQKLDALVIKEPIIQCDRTYFYDSNPFIKQKPVFKNNKKVVGLHLNGSQNSLIYRKKTHKPLKEIPPELVHELSEYNVLVFGLPEEIKASGLKESDAVKFVAYPYIAKSLSYVEQCDAMIASDSAIKTLSCALNIPTLMWVGNNEDYWRDLYFVDPYVKAGVMQLFKYDNLASQHQFFMGINKTKEFLNELFSA